MKIRTLRRPLHFDPLEPRQLPSALGPAVVADGLARKVQIATLPRAVVPTPGNRALPFDLWIRLHDLYAARARLGEDDVVFLGDSITYLWGGLNPPGPGSPAWDAVIAPLKAANFGIGSDQTQSLLWRVEHGELAGRPRVAVVMIGINNLFGGQTPNETAAGVLAIVRAIRQESPGTAVLLLGLLPVGKGPSDPIRPKISQVNAILANQSRRMHISYLNTGSLFLRPDRTLSPGLMMDHFVHPTEAGYWIIAGAIEGPLHDLLQSSTRGATSVTPEA